MSVFSAIASKLKEILKVMVGGRTIEQALHVTPSISSQMEEAIETWTLMYKNQAPWLKEPSFENPNRITSLGLPAMIASEKARMALIEFKSKITTPTEEVEVENPKYEGPLKDDFGNLIPSTEPEMIIEEKPIGNPDRAEYLNEQYVKLKRALRTQIEYGIAKGGLVIKPYVVVTKATDDDAITPTVNLEFDYIQADSFYPLAFDASGRITEAAFLQTKSDKDIVYRRLEYHKWQNNKITVINKAYKSTNNNTGQSLSGADLGHEISLKEVPEWSEFPDKVEIKNVDRPLFAYFKMPEANTIDTTSPLGVSGFDRAKHLIKDADIQYSTLLWEYEGGALAIDIDRDALSEVQDHNGDYRTAQNHLQSRLFRRVDLGVADTYQPFAPALRDKNYIDGLNAILMRIEDVCAISRGTLSDAAAEARTATELKILKQRSFQTNKDIQEAIEDTLRDVIYIMNTYCTLYEITPEGEYDVSFEWDDSLIIDMDEELNKRISMMHNGIASKLETRMWYFGETERQAEEALIRIDEETMKDAQTDLALQSNYTFVDDKTDSRKANPFSSSKNKEEEEEKEKEGDK